MNLTDTDIRTINAARDVLDRLASEADRDGWEATTDASEKGPYAHWCGRMAERASDASNSLFQALNCAFHYMDREMTDEQLYNREEESDGREPDGERWTNGVTVRTDR